MAHRPRRFGYMEPRSNNIVRLGVKYKFEPNTIWPYD
jgi:hypothetical protein